MTPPRLVPRRCQSAISSAAMVAAALSEPADAQPTMRRLKTSTAKVV
jgi:hypothetical protein